VALVLVIARTQLKRMEWTWAQGSFRIGTALERVSREGDLVVTVGHYVGDPTSIYYSRRRGWSFPPALGAKEDWIIFGPDDQRAIRMFELLRFQSADWLAIDKGSIDNAPKPRVFWFHYPHLIEHSYRTCELVEDTDSYLIFRIPAHAPEAEPQAPATQR
jgi:hypothetical protein